MPLHFLSILLLAFYGPSFLPFPGQSPANAEAAPPSSLKFGTSTLAWPQRNWKHLFSMTQNSNRFLTLSMDRAFQADCTSAGCKTALEWETQVALGRDGQNCHLEGADEWEVFSPVRFGENGVGLATNLHDISASGNLLGNSPMEGRQRMLLLLLPSARPPYLEAGPELLQQISSALNATQSETAARTWNKQNCEEMDEEQREEASLAIGLGRDGHAKVRLNALDLAVQLDDANGTCQLAISHQIDQQPQWEQEEEGSAAANFSLILSIFPRQCLLLNVVERKMALVPRKWPQRRGQNWRVKMAEENKFGKRREVSDWLGFVFSLI